MFYFFSGPGLPLRQRVLSKADDLCDGRARAAGPHARSDEAAARHRRCRARQYRALARHHPEFQLLHHQAHEDGSACRPDLAARCRSCSCSWSARARASARSRRSRLTRTARCRPAARARRRMRRAACASSSRASDGVEKTLYYFSTDLSNGGVKSSGFLKFCATLAPGNSLIKSASYLLHSGSFTDGARLPARQQRHHHPGRFRHSARQLQCEKVAVLPVRPLCRPDRRIPRPVSAILCRTVPPGAADGFRHRLSLAHP